ncbi:DNA-binding protein [Trametopsis cervina]|nr:DNA-binding protein [Trametopsis cervina]
MQAQATRVDQTQNVLTAQQSLQSIQTLLRAGLGCITYLRNLLPADNFSESYLTSASAETQPATPSYGGSFASDSSKRNVSGFKIMTVARGYTEEADKLLDYLENGIFDALQKQYLRSFIFAIYLDNDDPNNIVEAYTFNFRYYNIPGTNISVPVMSLGDDLMKLSISGGKKSDPVTDATKKGKVPTLGEVKRSLKTLIKNLIQATTQMDALPRRRYATFKLYYHDHTPDDYEPPYFRAGDSKKDKWFFSTHSKGEIPEKCSVGEVQTGWHSVDLRVASVSAYLPSAEDNNAPFLGTTIGGQNVIPPTLSPSEESALRAQQSEAQRQDALERRVVWDAEEGLGDEDADGSDDDGGQAAAIWRVNPTGLEFISPLGLRGSDGSIMPIASPENQPCELPATADALFEGVKENVPRHVGQLQLPLCNSGDLTQTQQIDQTQVASLYSKPDLPSSSPLSSPSPTTPKGNLHLIIPDSSIPQSASLGAPDSPTTGPEEQETIDTQMLKRAIAARRGTSLDGDAEMLEMETQVQPCPDTQDDHVQPAPPGQLTCSTRSLSVSQMAVHKTSGEDDNTVSDCECGVITADCDGVMCDDCNKWFHIWCMGYHSAGATNLPDHFICFDCRVRADQNWDLIMVHNLHPRMMEKFKDLALFRRAIKICEISSPDSLSLFTKLLGCESLVSNQLFKRLENEGFIALQAVETDDHNLTQTNTRRQKNRNRSGKLSNSRRKSAQRSKFGFVHSMLRSQEYNDYFTPNSEAEKRLLGLADLNPKKSLRDNIVREETDMEQDETESGQANAGDRIPPLKHQLGEEESQTQPETQLAPDSQESEAAHDLKRKTAAPSEDERRMKKVKMSIGPTVDLGD